jgi:hypothetical protein
MTLWNCLAVLAGAELDTPSGLGEAFLRAQPIRVEETSTCSKTWTLAPVDAVLCTKVPLNVRRLQSVSINSPTITSIIRSDSETALGSRIIADLKPAGGDGIGGAVIA